MNLFEMDLFIEAITRYLELDQPVRIVQEGNELTWEPVYESSSKKDLESVQVFSNYLFKRGRVFDFRALGETEFHKIRSIVDLLEQFIHDRKEKYPIEGEAIIQEAEHKLLALRLGGRIDHQGIQKLDPDLIQFLRINQFDKKCFVLGLQLSETLAIPFEIEGGIYQELLWKDLQKQEVEAGYRFFYKEQFLMETDKEFRLKEDFSVLYRGITFYHPRKALHIAHIDKRNPVQWGRKNILEVIKGSGKIFILLRKEEGEMYCIGIEEDRVTAPVEAYYNAYQGRYPREITKQECDAVLEVLQRHKYYKKGLTEKELLKIVQEKLKLPPLPEKPLVTRNKILSYLTLPYALWKFYRHRKEYPGYRWRDVVFTPYKVSKVDQEGLKEWIA